MSRQPDAAVARRLIAIIDRCEVTYPELIELLLSGRGTWEQRDRIARLMEVHAQRYITERSGIHAVEFEMAALEVRLGVALRASFVVKYELDWVQIVDGYNTR